MNVSLPDDVRQYVERRLASGDYQTSSELVREALRLLQAQAEAAERVQLGQLVEATLSRLRSAAPDHVARCGPALRRLAERLRALDVRVARAPEDAAGASPNARRPAGTHDVSTRRTSPGKARRRASAEGRSESSQGR